MSDRLAEIRARLRAANESARETWQMWPSLDDFLGYDNEVSTPEQAALAACAPSDIEYLLARVQEQDEHLRVIASDLADAELELDRCRMQKREQA